MTTILLTAVITAAITLFVVALWGHFHLQPRLKRALKQELDEEARKADPEVLEQHRALTAALGGGAPTQ